MNVYILNPYWIKHSKEWWKYIMHLYLFIFLRSFYRRKGLLSPFQFLGWVAHSFKSKYSVHFESFIVQCLFKTHVHTLDFLANQSAKCKVVIMLYVKTNSVCKFVSWKWNDKTLIYFTFFFFFVWLKSQQSLLNWLYVSVK